MHRLSVFLFKFTVLLAVSSVPHIVASDAGPIVELDYGTFQGSTADGIDKFLGIQFGTAGRFEPPGPPPDFGPDIQQAVESGPACPQQQVPGINYPTRILEDCLFVNIIKPASIPEGKMLPVVIWIYGGGFVTGYASEETAVVERSMRLNEPVVYVSANYRLSAYGFSGSEEIKAAGIGNLGLKDQRFALQWVQENIHHFGGDKNRVTIWGQSAGAISIGLHMVVDNGNQEGLFHGAFMQSGAPLPLEDITSATGQASYDLLVASTSCETAENTLDCLKKVPFDDFQVAATNIKNDFTSAQVPWVPRVDGEFITKNPWDSLNGGDFSNIPVVNGNCDDEGTVFAQVTIAKHWPELMFDRVPDYLHKSYFPDASDDQFTRLMAHYPNDPSQGSPFDTGKDCDMLFENKRIAAFVGDYGFQAPRQFFISKASERQAVWSFLYKRGKHTTSPPCLGSAHSIDIPEFSGSGEGTDFLINFINTRNPNVGTTTSIDWPGYDSNNALLTFIEPAPTLNITAPDPLRLQAIAAMMNIMKETGDLDRFPQRSYTTSRQHVLCESC